jgi:hypothetical protein
MSLFDSASIVVTPNAYKASKLYAIKPIDGSGDLTVVRATSATRVDANGLVEIPRTNLFTNSEGNLATYGTAIGNASNATVSINGFSNSIQIGNNSLATSVYKTTFTPVVGVQYNMSIFVQMDDNSLPVLGSTILTGDFSLIINNTLATLNPVIQQVGSSNVYKVSATFIATTTSTIFGVNKYIGQSAKGFRFTGIQLEVGNVATEYIPTVASIRTKFAGITQDGSSASNIPRLDYTNGTCPSILVEPQRTNLVLRSEEFDNASWIGVNGGLGSLPTRTPNVAIAPDGNLTADLVVFNINNGTSSADISQIQQNLSLTSSIHTFSVYAKSSDNITRIVKVVMPSGNVFNITITANWQRFTITDTAVGTGAIRLRLRGNESTAKIANLHLWGAQLEAGSNATSYIPTTTASVTRNADLISKTGISSLIGQTEGTVFADININNLGIPTRTFTNITGGSGNFINLTFLNTNVLRAVIRANAGTQYNVSTSALAIGRYKLAATYKAAEFKLYVNGVLIGTNTSVSVSWSTALQRLNLDNSILGTDNFSNKINLVANWKTALTDTECINLTTI